MKQWLRYLHLALIIGMIAFIWSNSFKTATESTEVSQQVVEVVEEVLDTVHVEVESNFLSFIVRKTAHGLEFFVLGLLMILYVLPYQKRILWTGITLLIGLAVASLDETFQSFSEGRGPAVEDVGIDMMGFSIAISIVLITSFVFLKSKPTKLIN